MLVYSVFEEDRRFRPDCHAARAAYNSLKTKNDKLSESLDKLQRQVDEQSGQLKVLLTFVRASLKEQVDMSAERAAARHLERLIAPRANPPQDDR